MRSRVPMLLLGALLLALSGAWVAALFASPASVKTTVAACVEDDCRSPCDDAPLSSSDTGEDDEDGDEDNGAAHVAEHLPSLNPRSPRPGGSRPRHRRT